VRPLSCSVSARNSGSPSDNAPTASIRHLHMVGTRLVPTPIPGRKRPLSQTRGRSSISSGWRGPDQARIW
jgi:hypothetical protein